jgi:hypothetical protein
MIVKVLVHLFDICLIMRLQYVPSSISCGLSVISSLNILQLYSKTVVVLERHFL